MPTIHIRLDEHDYIAAARAASAPSPAWLITSAVMAVAVLVGLIWLWQIGYGRESIAGVGALIGTVVGGWIGRGISMRAKAKRVFRQQKELHRPFELSWNADAITLTAEHGTSMIPWPDFHKRRETAGLFLLFLSDATFLMVPKRAFPETGLLETFRSVLATQVPVR